MIRNKRPFTHIFILMVGLLFFLNACSNLPIIGKKKEKEPEKTATGKTVSIEGMEQVKGVNPPKAETSSTLQKTFHTDPSTQNRKR